MTTAPATTAVGTIDQGVLATVDGRGALHPAALPVVIEWWIGADDRWHDATQEAAVRQRAVGDAPVLETLMRVPGGDAIARVFATSDAGGGVVVEVENDSASPFALALVVRPAGTRLPSVELDGLLVRVAGQPLLVLPRPPGDVRWPGETRPPQELPEGLCDPTSAVVVLPVAHRSKTRVGVLPANPGALSLAALPDADAVARAWRAQLQRGMQVEVPDARWQSAITRARAQVLLWGSGGAPVDPAEVVALEDWGFDAEMERAWERLGLRAKRQAARRSPLPAADAFGQADALAVAHDAGPLPDPAGLLTAVRAVLVAERRDAVDLLPFCADAWKGGSLDVRAVPTRLGMVSYAIRWHGARPALLWECSDRIPLRCGGLSDDWTTVEPTGETLLAPPVS